MNPVTSGGYVVVVAVVDDAGLQTANDGLRSMDYASDILLQPR